MLSEKTGSYPNLGRGRVSLAFEPSTKRPTSSGSLSSSEVLRLKLLSLLRARTVILLFSVSFLPSFTLSLVENESLRSKPDFRSPSQPRFLSTLLDNLERGFSVAFDVEIILRFLTTLPEWKAFFLNPRNDFDLALAVVSSIIQVPVILTGEAHGWLTIFPLARWYRVIL